MSNDIKFPNLSGLDFRRLSRWSLFCRICAMPHGPLQISQIPYDISKENRSYII